MKFFIPFSPPDRPIVRTRGGNIFGNAIRDGERSIWPLVQAAIGNQLILLKKSEAIFLE
jgi:hypothetical protein